MAAESGPPPNTGQTLLDRWLVQFWKNLKQMTAPVALKNCVDDAAAAAAGVPVGAMYRNGSVIMVRVS